MSPSLAMTFSHGVAPVRPQRGAGTLVPRRRSDPQFNDGQWDVLLETLLDSLQVETAAVKDAFLQARDRQRKRRLKTI